MEKSGPTCRNTPKRSKTCESGIRLQQLQRSVNRDQKNCAKSLTEVATGTNTPWWTQHHQVHQSPRVQHCCPRFAEGGICSPDTWAAAVAPRSDRPALAVSCCHDAAVSKHQKYRVHQCPRVQLRVPVETEVHRVTEDARCTQQGDVPRMDAIAKLAVAFKLFIITANLSMDKHNGQAGNGRNAGELIVHQGILRSPDRQRSRSADAGDDGV